MFYGLDVHKLFIQVCKLGKDGAVLANYRIDGDREGIEKFAVTLTKSDSVVLETTFNSYEVYSILKKSKARVVVSDSNQVKAIAHARVKTDKVDAEILAKLLKADFIPEVHLPSEETWDYRQLISHLRMLSKQRTMKNSIWGVLNRHLIKPPMDIFTNKGLRWLREVELSHLQRLQMDNLLNLFESIKAADEAAKIELESIAKKEKNVQLLLSIPGVGLKVALGFISAIGDINRFDEPNKLASYFGLTPSISQSADREYRGSITKEGTSYGRWPITASYFKIKNKKGHNVAVTALARKLIVVVWHMLKKQESYRYAKPERVSEKLRAVNSEMPTRYTIEQKKLTTNEIYEYAKLPKANHPSEAEKRAAIRNKKYVTSHSRKKKDEQKQKFKSMLD
jgi:transposase